MWTKRTMHGTTDLSDAGYSFNCHLGPWFGRSDRASDWLHCLSMIPWVTCVPQWKSDQGVEAGKRLMSLSSHLFGSSPGWFRANQAAAPLNYDC